MGTLKMRDVKIQHKNAWLENVGMEKAGNEQHGTPYVK